MGPGRLVTAQPADDLSPGSRGRRRLLRLSGRSAAQAGGASGAARTDVPVSGAGPGGPLSNPARRPFEPGPQTCPTLRNPAFASRALSASVAENRGAGPLATACVALGPVWPAGVADRSRGRGCL